MRLKSNLKQHAALIFTCVSVAGIFGTAILGVMAGIKAEKKMIELGKLPEDKKERIIFLAKHTWKCYVWVSLMALVSAGSAIASHKISAKDIARLATLATGSGAAFSKYRSKIREVLGDEKEKEIFEEVKTEQDWGTWPITTDQDSEEYNRLDTKYRLDLGTPGVKPVEFYSNQIRVLNALFHFERNFILGRLTNVAELKDFLGIPYNEQIDLRYFWCEDMFLECDLNPFIDFDDRKTGEFDEGGKEIRLITFEMCPPINEEEFALIESGGYWDEWRDKISD